MAKFAQSPLLESFQSRMNPHFATSWPIAPKLLWS